MSENAAPVTPSDRMTSVDVLRGVAVLGILTMNILSLGLPGTARLIPNVAGGFTGINYYVWLVGYFLFDEKMITIFSMLFGAGLVLMTDRSHHQGWSPTVFYYRRVGILFVIGLLHAYLIWDGDILVSYALCGMLVYPLRKLSPQTLVIVGVLIMLPSVPLTAAVSNLFQSFRDASMRVQEATRQGNASSDQDRELAEGWNEIRKAFHPTASEVAETIRQNHDESFREHVVRNAPQAFAVQTTIFGSSLLWTITGRMLIGMALMKMGIFSASQSVRYYERLAMFGYGLGWPIVGLAAHRLIRTQFDVVELFRGGFQINILGSIFVCLGHIAVVMLVYKAGTASWLTGRLASVGRMALTNYLTQSLLCTTFFNGYGFGYYGTFDRIQLYGIVLVVWALQLWYSPIWLRYFRFGPLEWLWRSMTYGAFQPVYHGEKR